MATEEQGQAWGRVWWHRTFFAIRKNNQIGVDLAKKKEGQLRAELPQTNAITSFHGITQWSHSSSRLRGLCPVLAEALQGGVGVLAAQGGSQHASAMPGCRPGLGHPPSRQKTSHGLRFIIIRLEKFRCSHENSHRTGGSCLYRFKLIQHPIPNTELKQHRESSPTGHGENMETQEKICQNPKWKSKFTNRMQKKTYWYCRGKIW